MGAAQTCRAPLARLGRRPGRAACPAPGHPAAPAACAPQVAADLLSAKDKSLACAGAQVVADPMKKPITLPARTPQVAAGAEDPAVRLCDPASGGFTHVLAGHRGAVWALAWSRTSEWHLATGAADGQVGPRPGLGSVGARARVGRPAAGADRQPVGAAVKGGAAVRGPGHEGARIFACLRAAPGRGRPPLARRDSRARLSRSCVRACAQAPRKEGCRMLVHAFTRAVQRMQWSRRHVRAWAPRARAACEAERGGRGGAGAPVGHQDVRLRARV